MPTFFRVLLLALPFLLLAVLACVLVVPPLRDVMTAFVKLAVLP